MENMVDIINFRFNTKEAPILCLIFALLFAPNAYSQLVFKTDSLRLCTIGDFHYDSRYTLDDIYEGVMTDGPIVFFCGRLRNDSEHGIIVFAYEHDGSDLTSIADVEFNTVFDYRGRTYETAQKEAIYDFHLYPWIFDNPQYRESVASIDGKKIDILYLEPGESIALEIESESHFLKDSRFCHLKERRWRQRHFLHNVREGEKLERIAYEVFPSIRISPKVVINDAALYETLIQICRTE